MHAPAAAPMHYRTPEEVEDECIERAISAGLTDPQIAALADLECAPDLFVRMRAKRDELQREQR